MDRTLGKDRIWALLDTVISGPTKYKSTEKLDYTSSLDAIKIGTTLTIQPGTTIVGYEAATLVISRGSRIMAVGTREEPIVFESIDEGLDGASEWGGVLIMGLAPNNECFSSSSFCNLQQEKGQGFAGGNRSHDDSGELRYVVITESGHEISEGQDLNGLTLASVGSATKLNYIQVHNSGDDGIQISGGAPFLKHVLISDFTDDGIDWSLGYQGGIQHALILSSGNTDRGIEADNSDTNHPEDLPRSMPTVANLTVFSRAQSESSYGLYLRSGSGGFFDKIHILKHDTCMRIADSSSQRTVEGTIQITNSLFQCRVAVDSLIEPTGFTLEPDAFSNLHPSYELVGLAATTTTEFRSNQFDGTQIGLEMPNGFFDDTNYIGAIDPEAEEQWWEGWTIPISE